MDFDQMTIELLPDGTLKTTTDEISPANHDGAESFLRNVAKLAGGETTREARKDVNHAHVHAHEHGHTHQH